MSEIRISVPALNMLLHSSQFGQTNPDIFSTNPVMWIPVFLQKLISLATSCNDARCGVVTRIDVVLSINEELLRKFFTRAICSSDVPGGVSITMVRFIQKLPDFRFGSRTENWKWFAKIFSGLPEKRKTIV